MELTTHVDVDATPAEVWAVLTDVDRYPEWNPFMRITGRVNEGARPHVELTPPTGRKTGFRPTVVRAVPERELRWRGKLWLPGLFDGDHRFVIEAVGDGRTRVTHAESFSGVLTPLVWRAVGASTEAGFEAMNAALKHRVESGVVTPEDTRTRAN